MQTKQRNIETSSTSTTAIELAISNCLLKKLTKNYDESEQHVEYDLRLKNLESNIIALRKSLEAADIRHNTDILSSLIILALELKSKSDWNNTECTKYKKDLETDFSKKYQIGLLSILKRESGQIVFDQCLEKFNTKLTLDNFKKYPSMIDAYYQLLLGVKDYKVQISLNKALPAILNLVNDHIPENKIKGLTCCEAVLVHASRKNKDFDNGNYYEVVYQILNNAIGDKSLEITKLLCSCLLALLKLLPPDVQKQKCETFYSTVIEELSMESNFYRKKLLLESLHKTITLHGVNCVMKKKRFFEIILSCFNDCKVKEVKEVILHNTLQCLEEWIKYCWCTWCYQKDYKLLTGLFLVLYLIEKKERKHIKIVQNIIITLVGLSMPEQQDQAVRQMVDCSFPSPEYRERIKYIQTRLEQYRDKMTTV